jgi:hypothetical protein
MVPRVLKVLVLKVLTVLMVLGAESAMFSRHFVQRFQIAL